MQRAKISKIVKEDLSYNRQDFWETTSNKQLNFLQHIKTQLKIKLINSLSTLLSYAYDYGKNL